MGIAHSLKHAGNASQAQAATPRATISVAGCDHRYFCKGDQTVLHALTRSSFRPVSSGCHAGGCGVCRVRVIAGNFHASAMSRTHVSQADEAAGIVLACCIWPLGDLTIEPLEKLVRPRTPAPSPPLARRHLPTDPLEIYS